MSAIDPDSVAWIAPEVKRHFEDVARPDDPYSGEYRIVEFDQTGAKFGPLVVWVDDKPNDLRDGTGHYEMYSGDKAAYEPQRGK